LRIYIDVQSIDTGGIFFTFILYHADTKYTQLYIMHKG